MADQNTSSDLEAGFMSEKLQKLLHDLKHFPTDVVVQNGNKKWNLHGAMLTSRSEMFKTALLKDFKA
ncbi:hypothetical protein F5B17DRAFT_433738 [Nemania serpens]|nr:hypothetical protein F5B17DRAFT_433738 [Nemania serpens]